MLMNLITLKFRIGHLQARGGKKVAVGTARQTQPLERYLEQQ